VNFRDSSAILPLLVREATTPALQALYESEPEIVAWCGTTVECISALARLERDGQPDAPAVSTVIRQLNLLAEQWHEVQPVEPVRQTAARLLRAHSLRTADSLQLAAALLAAEQRAGAIAFVCLDQRLRTAAEREGFPVVAGN
jgi:predicted nucleic acid-binding protein